MTSIRVWSEKRAGKPYNGFEELAENWLAGIAP